MSIKKKVLVLSCCFFMMINNAISKIDKENKLKKDWQCISKNNKWHCVQTNKKLNGLFDKNITGNAKNEIVARALGWVEDDSVPSLLGGYYYQSLPSKNADLKKTYVSFNSGKLSASGKVLAQGGVNIQSGLQTISANQAKIKFNPKTKAIEDIGINGNVYLNQTGQMLITNSAEIYLKEKKAYLEHMYYMIKIPSTFQGQKKETWKTFSGYAHGYGDYAEQLNENYFKLKNVTYKTGSPFDNSWHIKAGDIHIDRETEKGHLYNSIFYVKDVPIFYLPYLNFPLSDKRQTGFLYPNLGYENDNYYFAFPFYINLATNYDLLITPTIYNHRGVMLSNEFRYLTIHNEGSINFNYMPHDRDDKISRKFLNIINDGDYNNGWTTSLNYTYVGDNDYFKDFSGNNIFEETSTLYGREFKVEYNSMKTYFSVSILDYGILDETLTLANRPYETLPQINYNYTFNSILDEKLFPSFDSQYTYFYKDSLNNEYEVSGQRLYLEPSLSYPNIVPWGFFNTNFSLKTVMYDLKHTEASSAQSEYPDKDIVKVFPILNFDTGLYFEKKWKSGNKEYTQILEPRLFYTYIPNIDQRNIPVFDTSFTNFTYSSLFEVNRFSGLDRTNNANQMSYSVETNIQDSDGVEKLSFGIGQMVYFQKQRVTLCRTEGCIITENPQHSNTFSNVVSYFDYMINQDWSLKTSFSFNPSNSNIDDQSYLLQYKPNNNYIFNVQYENVADNYSLLTPEQILDGESPPSTSQIGLSGIYFLNLSWSFVGSWKYSFDYNSPIDMFAGFKYDAATWNISFIVQRSMTDDLEPNNPSSLNGTFSNTYLVQLTLKGLGSSNNNNLINRLNTIPGYDQEYSTFG